MFRALLIGLAATAIFALPASGGVRNIAGIEFLVVLGVAPDRLGDIDAHLGLRIRMTSGAHLTLMGDRGERGGSAPRLLAVRIAMKAPWARGRCHQMAGQGQDPVG